MFSLIRCSGRDVWGDYECRNLPIDWFIWKGSVPLCRSFCSKHANAYCSEYSWHIERGYLIKLNKSEAAMRIAIG